MLYDSGRYSHIGEEAEKSDDYGNTVQYVNGDKEFVVDKIELTASIGFDTEHYDPEIIKINGIDAVYYRSDYNEKGIIFNDGNYIYMIEGNIEKDELFIYPFAFLH